MVKLRHISGSNLKVLEGQLETIELPIIVHSVNRVGSNWYIHFLVQGVHEEKQRTKKVVSKKTKTIRRK